MEYCPDNRVTELRLKHAFTLLTAENLIDVRICDIAYPELSLAKVAQSLSISARYLQRLLESSGTSFTAHVTELRLKHAFTLLTAENLIDVHICDIALQAGFSDISHFNRLFRSRFGETPKGVRANQQTACHAN